MERVLTGRRRYSLAPRLYELVTLLHIGILYVAVRVLLRIPILPLRSHEGLVGFCVMTAEFVAGGVATRWLFLRVRRGPRRARAFLALWRRPRCLGDAIRFIVFAGLVSYGYAWLKLLLPLFRTALYDDFFYRIDNLVHLGVNPNRFVLALLPYEAVWKVVDEQYALFFLSMMLGIAWFGSTPRVSERARFGGGFALLWLAGSWLYLATPCLGPCYVFPEEYAAVKKVAVRQASLQGALIRQYTGLRVFARTREGSPSVNATWGVAAMPSLHVAGQAFLALFARRRWPLASRLLAAMTAMTFFGSLVTGWHYAVDGYVGVLLALAAAWFAERSRP